MAATSARLQCYERRSRETEPVGDQLPDCACGCGRQVGSHSARWLRGHDKRRTPHDAICSVPGCERKPEARGLCHSHFEYVRRTGKEPLGRILDTDEARFLAKVKKLDSGHWIWTGSTASEGRYGNATLNGRLQPAHRVAWQLWRGPIPDGLDVDHRCRRTLCVNPDHLEPKTHRANVLCGEAPSALNAAKTHCKRGHEFTPETTRIMRSGGRACVACEKSDEGRANSRERTRRYRERKRAAAAA